jgi:hypothetical protein
MQKWMLQGLLPLVGGLALLLGLIGLGRAARASLHDRAAYRLAFTDIDCHPPEGMSRVAFLREVRARSRQPEALHVLDEDLTARLYRAFLVHPWVESVRQVDIERSHSANRNARTAVIVEITYRRPVLVVADKRMVDRDGILLPEMAPPSHLPVLTAEVRPPSGPAGSRWGDARVAVAAKTAAFLQAHLARLHLENSRVEVIEGEIVLRRPGVRIVWGHAPGQEKEGEAPAQVKLRRLLDYQNAHNGLESLEHDVRLLAYQGHFPLSVEAPTSVLSLYDSSQPPSIRNWDHVSNSSRSWRSCFNDANAPSASASSR